MKDLNSYEKYIVSGNVGDGVFTTISSISKYYLD